MPHVDPDLAARLKSDEGPLDVVIVLDLDALRHVSHSSGGSVMDRRHAFAQAATEALGQTLDRANRQTGQKPLDQTLFGNLASVRIRAPAAFVRALVEDPAVASAQLNA